MTRFGFGRPKDGVIQIAFTVPDLQEAIGFWTSRMNVGPWFVAERFSGDEPVYRGAPCLALINAALSFAGDMQVELIELANDEPGIQRDAIRAHGHGFHHFGRACTDIDRERARYESLGYSDVFCAVMPSGDLVHFMEPPAGCATGLVELIAAGAEIDAAFTRMWRASVDWDGERPTRRFEELFGPGE